MTREAKLDLENLQNFASQYSLTKVLANASFNTLLPQQHGRCLALLIVMAEFEHQRSVAAKERGTLIDLPTETQLAYLKESISDLTQSFFCWIHGAYKASRVMLRSSIETFVKGMVCAENPGILTEKNVYKVFEIAEGSNAFSKTCARILLELNTRYGDLSKDVHTANAANMSHLSALCYFPSFQPVSAKSASDLTVYIATRQLLALCINFNAAFHQMHHRNRETILEYVPKSYKKTVHNIE